LAVSAYSVVRYSPEMDVSAAEVISRVEEQTKSRRDA
jgi:hypothetical protein